MGQRSAILNALLVAAGDREMLMRPQALKPTFSHTMNVYTHRAFPEVPQSSRS